MKHLLLIAIVMLGFSGPLQARDHAPHWPGAGRDGASDSVSTDHEREEIERRMERFAERRERLRALREEMLRTQPRPGPTPYRDDDLLRDMHRMSPERRDPLRQPMPPLLRDNEGVRESSREGARENTRRLTPEERREFRRQLHDAGRNVYRGQ
ncbi:MAG TPA: hypothetical protein VLC92_13100 [Rhodocyclaceae bacterium]|nr:hypothetical protein [Rhodocyclaceae bacterium]